MKYNNQSFLESAEKAVVKALSNLPFIRIVRIRKEDRDASGLGPDFVVEIESKGKKKRLLLEAKKNGQPRIARAAVNQLLQYCKGSPDSYPIFLAPYISTQAASICEKDGVGHIDFAGNSRLAFDTVYIAQEGKPNPFSEKRELRSLYSPKAERILRVLLNHPGRKWKMKELSETSQVSLGQLANVKKRLLDREWIDTDGLGLYIVQPELLIQEWAENYSFRRNQVFECYSLKDISEIEAEISEFCRNRKIPYALTGFSGAGRLVPGVRYRKAMVYIAEFADEMWPSIPVKQVETGANILLLRPYDDGVFYNSSENDDSKIVSPVQLYLDLIGYRGRGEEAAEMIFEEILRPKW